MRFLLVVWLSGILAGVVLMERWRRRGDSYVSVESIELSIEEAAPASTSSATRIPNVVGLVVTGAKLDAERVRRRFRPVDASRADAF
jgi:hypothetical protein